MLTCPRNWATNGSWAARRAPGGGHLLHPPLVQHHDLVGDLEGLLLVVGDEQAGHVHLVVEPPQPGAELVADLGVERAERLVEEQDLGPGARARARADPLRWPPES